MKKTSNVPKFKGGNGQSSSFGSHQDQSLMFFHIKQGTGEAQCLYHFSEILTSGTVMNTASATPSTPSSTRTRDKMGRSTSAPSGGPGHLDRGYVTKFIP